MQFEENGCPEESFVDITRFTEDTSVYAAMPTNEIHATAIIINHTRIQFFLSLFIICFKPLTTFP
jgi:hypothetical protein